MKVLVLTDNIELKSRFKSLLNSRVDLPATTWHFAYSPANKAFASLFAGDATFCSLNVKREAARIAVEYDLVISLHCKQLFPVELVSQVRCVNIHPGLNPYNRGWFPQVFSILNGLPLGATIHEIDEHLDHGPIIAQREVPVFEWDTSLSAYNRVLDAEVALLREHLTTIVSGRYRTIPPATEGNLNLRADFEKLRRLELDKFGSFREFYNQLRALSHGEYRNGFFIASDGSKVFLRIEIDRVMDSSPNE
jgi:dTDP-4-amino-4,6-dideoxyglucose formyltransferase